MQTCEKQVEIWGSLKSKNDSLKDKGTLKSVLSTQNGGTWVKREEGWRGGGKLGIAENGRRTKREREIDETRNSNRNQREILGFQLKKKRKELGQ